jgi:hypothetical protein
MTEDWLLKIVIIWFSIDTLVISTAWYTATTLRQIKPDWWRQVVLEENDELLNSLESSKFSV